LIGWFAGLTAASFIQAIDHWNRIGLAFVGANIFVVALAIGLATFSMTTIGVMIGQVVGKKFGRLAEALGGISLIVIGTTILIEAYPCGLMLLNLDLGRSEPGPFRRISFL
jgi:putative Mn2+ efflux pump MntP